jgi:hypothetical protein
VDAGRGDEEVEACVLVGGVGEGWRKTNEVIAVLHHHLC